ncbi:hypothetical protein EDC04DRAFT_2605803 [Pisolithus marmoratus]|nr:hypothetical protein EDC04DRAFT_2605803 [Pisolithus marmoratus]
MQTMDLTKAQCAMQAHKYISANSDIFQHTPKIIAKAAQYALAKSDQTEPALPIMAMTSDQVGHGIPTFTNTATSVTDSIVKSGIKHNSIIIMSCNKVVSYESVTMKTLPYPSAHAAATLLMSWPWLMQPTTSSSHLQHPWFSYGIFSMACPPPLSRLRLAELGTRRLIDMCEYTLSFYQSILCGTIKPCDGNTYCPNFPASKSVLTIASRSLSAIMNIFQPHPHMTGQWDGILGSLYHGALEMVFQEHDMLGCSPTNQYPLHDLVLP